MNARRGGHEAEIMTVETWHEFCAEAHLCPDSLSRSKANSTSYKCWFSFLDLRSNSNMNAGTLETGCLKFNAEQGGEDAVINQNYDSEHSRLEAEVCFPPQEQNYAWGEEPQSSTGIMARAPGGQVCHSEASLYVLILGQINPPSQTDFKAEIPNLNLCIPNWRGRNIRCANPYDGETMHKIRAAMVFAPHCSVEPKKES
ncbi:hypothetical protein K438DRAFT_1791312 [Mycena galopus ATCC 62051]|nr:hypothetical protein K438DRAFT_1791312 [Mycena galopus ATCC 62051]